MLGPPEVFSGVALIACNSMVGNFPLWEATESCGVATGGF